MIDRERDFEEMADPPLADRLRAFEVWLEAEPCTHPGNAEVIARIREQGREPEAKFRGCIVVSSSRRMCPACRLRHAFYHCIYNAEAYEGTSGEIPRRAVESGNPGGTANSRERER